MNRREGIRGCVTFQENPIRANWMALASTAGRVAIKMFRSARKRRGFCRKIILLLFSDRCIVFLRERNNWTGLNILDRLTLSLSNLFDKYFSEEVKYLGY